MNINLTITTIFTGCLLFSSCSGYSDPATVSKEQILNIQSKNEAVFQESQKLWARKVASGMIGILFPTILDKKPPVTQFGLRFKHFLNFHQDGIRGISVYRKDGKKKGAAFEHIVSAYIGGGKKNYGPTPVPEKISRELKQEPATTTFSGSGEETIIKVIVFYSVTEAEGELKRLRRRLNDALKE